MGNSGSTNMIVAAAAAVATGVACGLSSLCSSLDSVPNSHESLQLHSTHSSSGSSPNRHDSSELDIVQSSLGSAPNSHDSGELNKVHSSSGSNPNSNDSGEFDSVQSFLGSVPNSRDSGKLASELDNLQSSLGSVPNSQDSGKLASELDNLQSSLDLVLGSCLIYLPLGSASAVGSVSIGWQFPPIGWVKCNVDGSSRKAHRSAGCGGVYRDGQGKWLCGFARKLKYCCSMKAEIFAIYTGLAEAWRLGFRQVIIESDSKSAVDLVNKGCSSSHSLGKPVKKARKYLSKEWQVNIVYLPRESNRAADWLSKFAHDLEVGVHELKKPPKRCSKIIFKDKALASCLPGSIAS